MLLNPIVYVVKNEYHIVVIAKEDSQVYIKIGKKYYYEENSGILPIMDSVHKIIIKQSVLDRIGKYQVFIKRAIDKTAYFPKYSLPEVYDYFLNINSLDNIKACYISDIHSNYNIAKKIIGYNKKIDLLICNGDFQEFNKKSDIMKLIGFLSAVTKGNIPVRGNHDTRGKYAELLPKYMGMDGLKGYFWFSFRSIGGIALDCGEDKYDNFDEYGGNNADILGANRFELYRKKELSFIKALKIPKRKYCFGVCHTSFMLKESMRGIFDIDENTYSAWAKELNTKNLDFMICGHIHKFMYSPAGDDRYFHNYPVITGAASKNSFGGIFISLNDNNIEFELVDSSGIMIEKYSINKLE